MPSKKIMVEYWSSQLSIRLRTSQAAQRVNQLRTKNPERL